MNALSPLRVVPASLVPEAALLGLRVTPAQRHFVGRIGDLLADAASRPGCEPMAIVRQGRPIGFYCIETVPRVVAGRDFDRPTLGLRGFFIDDRWQGKGLATQALQVLLERLAERHPQARSLVLAVDEQNLAARALYARAGFADSGERYHGGRHGPLHLLLRTLP